MKANAAKLIDFLRKATQLVIPIYQRTYSWTGDECQKLWDDVVRVGRDPAVSVHFLGSIVYIESDLAQVTHQPPVLVIDGQQRLTSVTLLLAALANAVGDTEPADGFSKRKLRNYYLRNQDESGERYYKLLLSQTDKDSLKAIVAETEQPKERSLRVTKNFELFEKLVGDNKSDLVAVWNGLNKLMVVDVALTRGQDNAQLIFESMNSTGLKLSQADLIRNFLLMGLDTPLQTRLYEQFWRPMEVAFGQEAYTTHFDAFMRHYLTVKTGEIPNMDEVYEAFKKHVHSPKADPGGVESWIKDIRDYAGHFCAMALGAEPDAKLKLAFLDLLGLKVDVVYPFLLELYHDYATKAFTGKDLEAAVRTIESYVFRRAVCAVPPNSHNKTFATFTKALKKDRYLESIQAHLLGLRSYRRFPSDEEFRRDMQTRDLYNFRNRSHWLRRMENHNRKELVAISGYTIEHILPQNENLSEAWKTALGPDWKRVQQTWLHTLGNLTLTGYNSEYSDKPFPEKRDGDKGFKYSPLLLNEGLGQLDQWTEDTIKARAAKLADKALKVWPAPKLPADVLAAYKSKGAAAAVYTIESHPFLLTDVVRPLFDTFRKEVLALDQSVTEEFLKLYVAYKAETNFVDIVPQMKRLRLTLNMPFTEISDPKGLCRDVTGTGHWSNGDVEVDLSALDQLPYVMGLVRQSFDRQMGGGGEA